MGLAVAGGCGALVIGVVFLTGLAAKERDDRFCVACHLHEAKFTRFTAAVPVDLAGAHRRADPAVECIGCHGGADLPMRLRVWSVAGFDTLRFLTGAYGEPNHMRLPLRDAECRRCHTPVVKPSPAAVAPAATAKPEQTAESLLYGGMPPPETSTGMITFHRIRDHETMSVTCVRCHATHVTGGDRAQRFIANPAVEPVCRECHPTL